MRIAVLSDIHGNLPALEAVLREVEREPVDRVVVNGDVFPGPMASVVLARLGDLALPVDYVVGNCEVALLAELKSPGSARVPDAVREAVRWNAGQLAPADVDWISRWPLTLSFDVPALGRVFFCHGTPRSENEIFTRLTAEERLRELFDPLDAALVVCGHTHMQFDRFVGATRVVNAGSIGMPFGSTGADWLMIGPRIELRHTAYDLAAAAERVRATAYPQAAEFADGYILNPPSESEILNAYAAAELRGA